MTQTLCALLLAVSPAAAQTLESAAAQLKAASAAFSHSLAERPREPFQVAQATPDACRNGRALERPVMVLRITPPGQPPIDARLGYDSCRTRTDDVIWGDATPPWAARYFYSPTTPWAAILETFAGSDKTALYVFYRKPGAEDPEVVVYTKPLPTATVAAGPADWNVLNINDLGVIPFKSARFTTY